MTLKLGSLFSGIGGIELGFERTGGFKTIWHCEIEPYPSAVLEQHWPDVPNLGDITKVNWNEVERPDIIVGGFPCQDISVAGRGAGIKEGTRSGLWSEYARAIRELRPRYVVVENVPMLARRGLARVLGDIASLGYDAEWFTIRASDVGAPHRRERLFIIAHPNNEPREGVGMCLDASEGWQPPLGRDNAGVDVAHADHTRSCPSSSGINKDGEKKNAGRERQPFSESNGHADAPDTSGTATKLEEYRSGGQEWQPSYAPQPEVLRQEDGSACTEGCGTGVDAGMQAKPHDNVGITDSNSRDVENQRETSNAPDTSGNGQRGRICGNGANEGRELQEHTEGEQPIFRGEAEGRDGESKELDAPDTRSQRAHGFGQGQVRRFPEFSWCEDIREVKELFNRPDIPEPLVRGVNDGLPRGMDGFIRKERTKALGNAVVPQVAEVVAERVLMMEEAKR